MECSRHSRKNGRIKINKTCRNEMEVNSASSWFSLCGYITMHGQQNIKNVSEPLGSVKCTEFLE
jgi:hypothetical protein